MIHSTNCNQSWSRQTLLENPSVQNFLAEYMSKQLRIENVNSFQTNSKTLRTVFIRIIFFAELTMHDIVYYIVKRNLVYDFVSNFYPILDERYFTKLANWSFGGAGKLLPS